MRVISLPIKVCFAVPHCYSLFNPRTQHSFGGSEVRAWLFGTGLAGFSDFKVCFTTFDHGQPDVERFGLVEVYKDCYFNSRRSFLSSRLFDTVRSLWRKTQSQLSFSKKEFFSDVERIQIVGKKFSTYQAIDADIYCMFGVSAYTAELIAYLRRVGKKSVLFLGSNKDLSQKYLKDPDKCNDYGSPNWLCRFAIEHADHILAQSDEQKKILFDRFHRKAITIKNPINLDDPHKQRCASFDGYYLWIGKSDHVKRPELFTALAKRFPKSLFVMVMNCSQRSIHAKILREKPANVKIYEHVPFDQIEQLFIGAKAYVSTSVFEGFPNTFLQAGKYGIPILSLTVDPDNFIEQYQCGFNAKGDFKSLSDKMLSLTMGEFLIWSTNIHKYIMSHHDARTKFDELVAYINGVLK